ncbi:MAG: hypothetical protein JXQ96_00175 [Cyclobacteriaceae bacterium]
MIDYKKLREIKDSTEYDTNYRSSTKSALKAKLGTIEKDASGKYGKFQKEPFRGKKIYDILMAKSFG